MTRAWTKNKEVALGGIGSMPPAPFFNMRLSASNPPDGHDCGEQPRPDAVPNWVTEDLIRRTLEIWGPRYGFKLTREDAIGIILTVSRLYGVLSRG